MCLPPSLFQPTDSHQAITSPGMTIGSVGRDEFMQRTRRKSRSIDGFQGSGFCAFGIVSPLDAHLPRCQPVLFAVKDKLPYSEIPGTFAC